MAPRPWFAALLAVAIGLALWAVTGAAPGEDGAHGFMQDESRCAACHNVEQDGADLILDPHLFGRSVVEICRDCHPPAQTGRSHPVEVDPLTIMAARDYPEALPLQWSDRVRSDVMTCGTCHNPHLDRFSKERLFSRQRSHAGRPGEYLTYFLRVRGSSPKEGFTPLCHACHPDL